MKTRAALPALLLAATAALTACGSGSDDQDEPELATGVMEGIEHGIAKGSEVEVPLDESVLVAGEQDALTTPANVLEDDRTAGRSVITITPISVEEGDFADFDLEGETAEESEQYVPYYVRYRADYVNGAVQRSFAPYRWRLEADGQILDMVNLLGGGSSVCKNEYSVLSFGEGAWIEGCSVVISAKDQPAPTAVRWQATPDGDQDVVWPLS